MKVTCVHCEAIVKGEDGRMSLLGVLPSVFYSDVFPMMVVFQTWFRVEGLPVGRHMLFHCLVDEAGDYPFAAEAAFFQPEQDVPVMLSSDFISIEFKEPGRMKVVFRVRNDEVNVGFIEAKVLERAPLDVVLN